MLGLEPDIYFLDIRVKPEYDCKKKEPEYDKLLPA